MGGHGTAMHFINHLGGLFSGNFSDAFFCSDPFGRGQIQRVYASENQDYKTTADNF
jgi:hypothetical protein